MKTTSQDKCYIKPENSYNAPYAAWCLITIAHLLFGEPYTCNRERCFKLYYAVIYFEKDISYQEKGQTRSSWSDHHQVAWACCDHLGPALILSWHE